MTIEERVKKLEKQIAGISNSEIYLKPSELAKIMKCSKNHIYVQIRKNNIRAIHIGGVIRIPLSQFTTTDTSLRFQVKQKANNKSLSIHNIKDSVFG